MIEEPPPLVFAKPAERPSAEVIERFRGAPTSFIVDAMGGTGALDWRIKPLVGASLLGVALTCDCGPLDNLELVKAAEAATLERVRGGLKELPVAVPALRRIAGT